MNHPRIPMTTPTTQTRTVNSSICSKTSASAINPNSILFPLSPAPSRVGLFLRSPLPRASLLATPSASPPPALLTIFMSWQWVNIPVAYVLPVEDSSSISSFSKRRTRYVDIIIRLSKRRASLFGRLKAGLTCSSFATQRKTRNGTEIVFPQVNIGLRGVHP